MLRISLLLFMSLLSMGWTFGQKVDRSTSEQSAISLQQESLNLHNPAESILPAKQALEYFDHINDSLKSQIYFSIGLNYGRLYVNDSANFFLLKALDYASSYPDMHLFRADIYNALGNVARSISLNEEAMNYFNHGLSELERVESVERYYLESKVLGNIGGIYFDFGEFEKSLQYAERSKELIFTYDFKDRFLIGYLIVAYASRAMGQLEKALENNKSALEYLLSERDSSYVGHLYQNIASIYKLQKQWNKALENFDAAHTIATKYGEEELIVGAMLGKAECFLGLGQFSLAGDLTNKVIDQAKESGLIPKIIEALEIQYSVFKSLGKYPEALQNRDEYHIWKDSLFKTDTQERIANIEIRYETQKKEQLILQLEQDKEINQLQAIQERQLRYIMFLVASLLLLSVGFIFYRYRLKDKTSRILDQKNIQLQRLNATKDRLFAIISHDLKSPLSAFSTVTSSLTENFDKLEKDQIKDYLHSLKDSSKSLYDMMNNLLHWALTQTGQVPYKPIQLDVAELLKDIVQQLRLAIESKQLKIVFDFGKDLVMESDANMLTIIFRNLIANAVKFSHIGKEVRLSAHKVDGKVTVMVEDQGIGLSSEDQSKLFLFETDVQQIGKSKEKGTGIGLRLCKDLTEKLNGLIEVSSQLGQGTRFTLSFPT